MKEAPRIHKRILLFPPRVAAAVAMAVLCLLARAASPQRPATPPPSSAPPLECTIGDGFTLAAVGDVILANPESANANPQFQAQLKILRSADLAFGNFEDTAIDIRHFKGSPQAENGGEWLVSSPLVPADLKKMGFSMLNRANNHATDWGVKGMEETDYLLDLAGIVHAGTGRNMAEARASQYLETPEGRVALVGMASSFTPMSVAANPAGIVPGRAGENVIRTTRWFLVIPEVMQELVKAYNNLPLSGPSKRPVSGTPKQLFLPLSPESVARFRLSDHMGFHYEMDPDDLASILRNIRQGKESSNFLIATIHCHEAGKKLEDPPDFLVSLAHQAIDNGADAFIGQGPHVLRGIEIYKGKPIFYSLGNYFFEPYEQQVTPPSLYHKFQVPTTDTSAEMHHVLASRWFHHSQMWTSVIAVSTYRHGQVSEICLYPIDLGMNRRAWGDRGVPHLASPDVARSVLEGLANLSKPFGTTIAIQGSVGIIRVPPAT